MRPQRTLARLVLLGTLVAAPAVARPPWAPSDQYDFFDSDSPTILDRKTSLRWDREVPLQKKTFEGATEYCRITFGGRLPTIKELSTILSEEPYSFYDGAALVARYLDRDAFPPEKTPVSAPYWTSTPTGTDVDGGPYWALSFGTGAMVAAHKMQELNTRCVKFVPPR